MQNIDWGNLPFGYMRTDYNVRCRYANGKWGEIEVSSSEIINIHMAATCLHYGQESFEGQKAFRCPDGKIRIFRIDENAARIQSTSRGLMMPEMPTELFTEMVKKVVKLNERFIPPYESGAALYIRPLMIGTGAQANQLVAVVDRYDSRMKRAGGIGLHRLVEVFLVRIIEGDLLRAHGGELALHPVLHHGPPGTARGSGGECHGILPGLCEECGLQRGLSHLG